MSSTKIAQHYYNLGRQKAAQDLLAYAPTRTKTAAPKISRNQLAALLGGSAAAGAGGMGIRKLLQGMGGSAGKGESAIRGLTGDQSLMRQLAAEGEAAALGQTDALGTMSLGRSFSEADLMRALKGNPELERLFGSRYGMSPVSPELGFLIP